MPLIYLSGAWVAGIFLGTEFNVPLVLLLTGLIPLPLLFFLRQRKRIIILSSLSLITLFAAATYSHSSLHTVNENSLRFYNDGGIADIKGMVARDARRKTVRRRLRLQTMDTCCMGRILSPSRAGLEALWSEFRLSGRRYAPWAVISAPTAYACQSVLSSSRAYRYRRYDPRPFPDTSAGVRRS